MSTGAPATIQTRTRDYLVMLVVMIVLTILEVAVAVLPGHASWTVALLLVLALAQAVYFALYTMHLARETVALRRMAVLPGVIAALYALVLVSESAWRHLR
ncbi:MAG TPA: cytochrome C oxidase subunit IV family protein [Myxococcaceae bacterium]|nr:cytochrome C oxidase subunit IV family protein [Myxococcaceae bacterium]